MVFGIQLFNPFYSPLFVVLALCDKQHGYALMRLAEMNTSIDIC